MTGGSLGLRTGSYGSLQQQQSPNSTILPIPSSPFVVRKTPKMLQSSAKEKERLLPWICKMAGRRRAGMLLIALVSLLFLLSLFSSPYKEEDVQEVVIPPRPISNNETKAQPDSADDKLTSSKMSIPVVENNSHLAFPSPSLEDTPIYPLFKVHPCDNFVVPPPPSDRRRIGPRPCPVCYLPVEQAMAAMPAVPSISPVLQNLSYVVGKEILLQNNSFGGSMFGGYPSLAQRDDSYNIKESMNVHCGFVRGNKPGNGTGFDIDSADLLEMEQCHGIVVASAVFGNYDEIQHPKNISDAAKRDVCFFMFVDEKTMSFINKTDALNSEKRLGLWRVVLVTNLPYKDPRRTGKVPKLLLHRLFPNVRFSIWIDGKLELVRDPFQILERFLWRTKATFAISRHYRRFDVFVEAEANKAAGKYDNASIDTQIEFYKKEGLSPYSSSKLPITSDVPEGCVIIREHIPITNLFTCLWFNEVDRFTSRDQLSFSTVRDKIMLKVNWGVNMFLDCERRNFVIQAYHRDVLEQKRNEIRAAAVAAAAKSLPVNLPPALPVDVLEQKRNEIRVAAVAAAKSLPVNLPKPPPALPVNDKTFIRSPVRKVPTKHARERKSGSRRRRSRPSGSKESDFS